MQKRFPEGNERFIRYQRRLSDRKKSGYTENGKISKKSEKRSNSKISYRKKEGHHYSDYLDFIAKNEGIRVVQMDTVEGNKGGKLLHTLLWPENNLMLAFLIETKEMKNTVAAFDWLEETLGSEMFRELFPVILTDNGCEFADPELFEKGHDGKKRTRVFYCESRHSEQKGELEKRIMST